MGGTAGGRSHASDYDGPETITATYTVNLKKDMDGNLVLDPTGSTITLAVSSFTDRGEQMGTMFTTVPIPITGVSVDQETSNLLAIDFMAKDWYSTDPKYQPNLVINNGITGQISLLTGTASITSSYIGKNSKTTYTYVFATPEPPTWLLMLSMLTGFGVVGQMRRKGRLHKFLKPAS